MADIKEKELWDWCKSHDDYEVYLMRYPNGNYATEAKALLNSDEKDEYENCALVSDYFSFLERYPNGEYSTRARTVIRSKGYYGGVILGQEEYADFKGCGTERDYRRYLEKYPNGRYRSQAELKCEEYKASHDAWVKEKINEEELGKCETIGDYERYIQCHEGRCARIAMNYYGALKNEPWQLILSFICNIMGVAGVVVGLVLNKVVVAGLVLLGIGLIELVCHFVVPFEYRALAKGDNYLQLSGYLSVIGGIIFLLM